MTRCPKCGCLFGLPTHTVYYPNGKVVNVFPEGVVAYSEHHIKPRRFFGDTSETIGVCRNCHDALEKQIPQNNRLKGSEYFTILNRFLGFV